MLPAFIVAFREILEIAIILGVVLAATLGIEGRRFWVMLGIVSGILGSVIIAFFTENIANFFAGFGQEILNASILFIASLMIIWTAIWMSTHAKNLIAHIKNKSVKIIDGDLPLHTISIIIALAVLREGSEIVLFSYGMLVSGEKIHNIILGIISGTIVSSILGILIYFSIIAIPTKYIFKVSTYLLVFLAAGMASIGAQNLVAADFFSNYSSELWDSSFLLTEESIVGKILHSLFGYVSRPTLIQVIFYLGTVGVFFISNYLVKKNSLKKI